MMTSRLVSRVTTFSRRSFGTGALPGTSQAEAGLGNSFKGRKRFYDDVSVVRDEKNPGYVITLDDRRLKTAKGMTMRVPTEKLAYAIAGEWARQDSSLEPESMPIYGLSSISLQINGHSRALSEEHIMGYLETDTTCVRVTEQENLPLHLKQKETLDPILEWFGEEFGKMETSTGFMVPEVSSETRDFVRGVVSELSDWEIAALERATRTCKSLVLGLCMLRRHVTAEEALNASRLEEDYQIENWGLLENGHDFDINFARLRVFSTSSFLWMIDSNHNELEFPLKRSKAWNMELVNDGTNMRTEPVPPMGEDKIDELFIDDSAGFVRR